MRLHILLPSLLTLSLSSCYVEVVSDHHHDDPYHEYPSSTHFDDLYIDQNLSYDQTVLLSSYALQLYSLSNQPHQLAFLNNSDNLLNDTTLAHNLIEGDMLGLTSLDIDSRDLSNTCNYGYLDITDYQIRALDNYYSNGELFEEFDGNFELHTSPICEVRNTQLGVNDSTFSLDGALNYNIFFKNYLSSNSESLTDELISTITGNWSVNNNSLGYWDIENFQSSSSYERFNDNIVWTEFSSNLEIHDHSKYMNTHLRIRTVDRLQTDLGVVHPYSGSIIIEDSHTNNTFLIEVYSESIDVSVNGRFLYRFIDWDEIINQKAYFNLI